MDLVLPPDVERANREAAEAQAQVDKWRGSHQDGGEVAVGKPAGVGKLDIYIRKRPLLPHEQVELGTADERAKQRFDAVTVRGRYAYLHQWTHGESGRSRLVKQTIGTRRYGPFASCFTNTVSYTHLTLPTILLV